MRQTGRHLPAFLLLFLARGGPLHGGELLRLLLTDLPHPLGVDSAGVYRALRDLEADGQITSEWAIAQCGPPRRVYRLTPEGRAALDVWKEDVIRRRENLGFFLGEYERLGPPEGRSPGPGRRPPYPPEAAEK